MDNMPLFLFSVLFFLFFFHCAGQNLELVSHVYSSLYSPYANAKYTLPCFFSFFDYLNIFLSHMKDDDNSCTQGQHRIRIVSNSLICTANRELNDVFLIGINFCFDKKLCLLSMYHYSGSSSRLFVFYGPSQKKMFGKNHGYKSKLNREPNTVIEFDERTHTIKKIISKCKAKAKIQKRAKKKQKEKRK